MRSTVLSMSRARRMKRSTRSPASAGRGPCARAARYASAAANPGSSRSRLPSALRTRVITLSRAALMAIPIASSFALSAALAHERVDARNAFGDRLGRRSVGEADVLTVARHAAAEMDVGQHRHASLVEQPLAELLGVRATRALAGLGHIGPRVKSAAGCLALDPRYLVEQADDQIAALEK